MEEMAGLLYDSIFNKILPLGDDVLLCPAHGAGSVCGSKIAERTWTTIGMERKYNPLCLVKSEKEFFELHGKMLDRRRISLRWKNSILPVHLFLVVCRF